MGNQQNVECSSDQSYVIKQNWANIGQNLYKNKYTEQIIQSKILYFSTYEQMCHGFKQQNKRIYFTNKNIVRLVYLRLISQQKSLCECNQTYGIKVYVERLQSNILNFYQQNQSNKLNKQKIKQFNANQPNNCAVVQILKGSLYLVQKYGFFLLTAENIWINVKQPVQVKLWISKNYEQYSPDQSISEKQMCQNIIQIIKKHSLCQFCLRSLKNYQNISNLKLLYSNIRKVNHHIRQTVFRSIQNNNESSRKNKSSSLYQKSGSIFINQNIVQRQLKPHYIQQKQLINQRKYSSIQVSKRSFYQKSVASAQRSQKFISPALNNISTNTSIPKIQSRINCIISQTQQTKFKQLKQLSSQLINPRLKIRNGQIQQKNNIISLSSTISPQQMEEFSLRITKDIKIKQKQNLTQRTNQRTKIQFSYNNDNSIGNSSMNRLQTHPISFQSIDKFPKTQTNPISFQFNNKFHNLQKHKISFYQPINKIYKPMHPIKIDSYQAYEEIITNVNHFMENQKKSDYNYYQSHNQQQLYHSSHKSSGNNHYFVQSHHSAQNLLRNQQSGYQNKTLQKQKSLVQMELQEPETQQFIQNLSRTIQYSQKPIQYANRPIQYTQRPIQYVERPIQQSGPIEPRQQLVIQQVKFHRFHQKKHSNPTYDKQKPRKKRLLKQGFPDFPLQQSLKAYSQSQYPIQIPQDIQSIYYQSQYTISSAKQPIQLKTLPISFSIGEIEQSFKSKTISRPKDPIKVQNDNKETKDMTDIKREMHNILRLTSSGHQDNSIKLKVKNKKLAFAELKTQMNNLLG